MTILRRHVRLWATAWLVLQAASLSAFVPRDCCAAHRPEVAKPSCHEVAPQSHCPMRAADGKPCPMHRAPETAVHEGHGSHGDHDAAGDPTDDRRAPERRCVIGGTCQGPTFALILSNPGLVPDATVTMPQLAIVEPASVFDRTPRAGFQPPHPRPPRA
jgi:hypothetical protein